MELFQRFGDVRGPQRVVQTIIEDRKKRRFESTLQLAGVIERVQGWKRKGPSPGDPIFFSIETGSEQRVGGCRESDSPLD